MAKTEESENCSTPYSPRLISTIFGPILRIARAALTILSVAAQQSRFRVVDHQHLDALQNLLKFFLALANPMIHGVAHHQLHAPRIWFNTSICMSRIDISEKNIFGVAVTLRQLGHETRQDVQMQLEGVAHD